MNHITQMTVDDVLRCAKAMAFRTVRIPKNLRGKVEIIIGENYNVKICQTKTKQ